MAVTGFQVVMRYRIIHRLKKAGATSKDKAVTIEEAGFNLQEQRWLGYFAGGVLSEIIRTEDKRYYV
ncbi:MAG: hypothetical protein JSW53_03990 [Candidatus Bathyarchaeota archaeon]|nr:MAG: hypothetical protein JSW53_03990 [Candidatus Bathyarchaeota archaeon]